MILLQEDDMAYVCGGDGGNGGATITSSSDGKTTTVSCPNGVSSIIVGAGGQTIEVVCNER